MKRFASILQAYLVMCIPAVADLGCAPLNTRNAIQPSECHRYQHRDIEISTKDGRVIRLIGKKYSVATRADSVTIEGNGTLYSRNGVYVGSAFEGRITESEMDEISLLRSWNPTAFGAALAIMAAALAFMLR